MNKSMTGYGMARHDDDTLSVYVEVKTLNSKYMDANLRLPKSLSDKEVEIRQRINDIIERGKVNLIIEYVRKDDGSVIMDVNEKLFKTYFNKFQKLSKEVNQGAEDIFRMAIQMPEVIISLENEEAIEKDWKIIGRMVDEALEKCDDFRKKEGDNLTKKLEQYAINIEQLLIEAKRLDPERIDALKQRLIQGLEELKQKDDVDKNRFEQELVYYIEKLDISEEKVRLKSHIEYFKEVLHASSSQGKKLNFISQEMGREINTMGAKANYAPLQKCVVNMKEELEKIKEQVLNLL
jgi:uncharacterized protein (TIGR00255 family)